MLADTIVADAMLAVLFAPTEQSQILFIRYHKRLSTK